VFQLQQPVTFEQVIKKSRFLATALPVFSEDEAKAAIAARRHADANHNCWAWRIGAVYRFSDDGEPGGTAGKPILAAIDGQCVDNAVVIVTRWFGGILLGSGGLMRAYGGTASACMKTAELVETTPSVQAIVSLEFSDLARVKAKLATCKDVTTAERYTQTGADLEVTLPEAEFMTLSRMIADLTSGRAQLRPA
jgi:uncharacterized YigZ family protein